MKVERSAIDFLRDVRFRDLNCLMSFVPLQYVDTRVPMHAPNTIGSD